MTLALASRRTALTPPWVSDPLWRNARAVPSLDLRFADNKSLTDAVTGASLVTFTRASSGTYVDSAGVLQTAAVDVPRFDHNPTTGESLGLLVQEARTNLCLQSEVFGTTWTVAGTASITADQAAAPNGATTADRVTVTSGGPNRVVQSGVSATSTTYTFSVYAKSDDINGICIRAFFSGGTSIDTYSNFVFSSKTFSDTAGSGTFAFQELSNGWFRLSVTIASGNNTAWEFRIGGLITTAQTGTKIFLWGAQLEAGAFATSYIPTTTAAATRAADVASITGANFSSWYNQTEGTVFVDFLRTYSGNFPNFPNIYQFNDGTDNNEITLFGIQGLQLFLPQIKVSASDQLSFVTFTSAFPGPNRSAHGFSLNNSTLAANGALTTTDTSVSIPIVDQLKIGSRSGQRLTGTIKRLTFWPQRLANSTLQQITQ